MIDQQTDRQTWPNMQRAIVNADTHANAHGACTIESNMNMVYRNKPWSVIALSQNVPVEYDYAVASICRLNMIPSSDIRSVRMTLLLLQIFNGPEVVMVPK